MRLRLSLIIAILLILSGCGQKGPLTLEKPADRTGQQDQQDQQASHTQRNKSLKEQQPQ